jgi:hypothetical protein
VAAAQLRIVRPMRALVSIALLVASGTTVSAQTIYYATFRGKNYEKKVWHSASLATFKAAPPKDVYDSYTVEQGGDGTVVVHRDCTTPSGDWRFEFTYEYGQDGRLHKLQSELVVFSSISASGKDAGSTRCVRTFTVSGAGTFHKTSERITDVKSGKVVARQFFQPHIKHWMSLDELPIHPKL